MTATPAWPPKSAPRLFVPGPLRADSHHIIEGQQAHYLARVMRVSPGDAVILCDDITGEWTARVVEAGKREITVELVENTRAREPVPDVWLCAALLKKDRFDTVLEKATELGADRIVPVLARRCVADKLNHDRALAVITEAAEQCARTALPSLTQPVRMEALLRDWPEERALLFADEEGGVPLSESVQTGPSAILVGPEGGWDRTEREAILAHPQARAVSLGPRILRAETAAISALSVWMALAGDWK